MSENSYRCKTAVAFFVFNRPELTRRVFTRIAESRPSRLLLIADGARADKAGEDQRCSEVRSIVSAVNWPCEVLSNFAENNMGCRGRLTSGLDWVFEQVEEAIILEDDVLPDPSFFRFCDEMLDRFREDRRVGMITGFNIVADQTNAQDSYFFSHLTHIWGWATWRRAWTTYDANIADWPAFNAAGLMEELFPRKDHRRYWTQVFDAMHAGTGPNTWDYQWFYTCLKNYFLAVTPGVNLIENLGFGVDATHTHHATDALRVPIRPLQFPLRHPVGMVPLRHLDLLDQDRSGATAPGLPRRVINKLRRTLLSARK